MDRKEILFKNLRIIFLLLVTFVMTLEIMIPAFSAELTDLFIPQNNFKVSYARIKLTS